VVPRNAFGGAYGDRSPALVRIRVGGQRVSLDRGERFARKDGAKRPVDTRAT